MESDFLFAKSLIRLNRMLASKEFIVMGIETSCDDTGIGIVSNKGVIMGEAKNSQLLKHIMYMQAYTHSCIT